MKDADKETFGQRIEKANKLKIIEIKEAAKKLRKRVKHIKFEETLIQKAKEDGRK